MTVSNFESPIQFQKRPSTADPAANYYTLVDLLGQSNAESTLHALAEGKTGNCDYDDFLSAEIVQRAESALEDFIKALADYKANDLINGSQKQA